MNTNYKLSISNLKKEKIDIKLGSDEKLSDTISATLVSVDYCKEIYTPGWIKIKILLKSSATLNRKSIIELLKPAQLSLLYNDFKIAENYDIFQISPSYQGAGTEKVWYVSITAYSPDKYLTLEKACRSWCGKKLFADIITSLCVTCKNPSETTNDIEDAGSSGDAGTPEDAGISEDTGISEEAGTSEEAGASKNAETSEDAGISEDAGVSEDDGISGISEDSGNSGTSGDSAGTSTSKFIHSTELQGTTFLNNLNYLQFKATDGNNYEFLIPYLVQYNESFYDFLVRTLNRYGEFLYHEESTVYVGLPTSTSNPITIKIEDISSITYNDSDIQEYATPLAEDYVNEEIKNGSTELSYKDEVTAYNYTEVVPKAYADFTEMMDVSDRFVTQIVGEVGQQDNVLGMLAGAATKAAFSTFEAYQQYKEVTKEYETAHLKNPGTKEKPDTTHFDQRGAGAEDETNLLEDIKTKRTTLSSGGVENETTNKQNLQDASSKAQNSGFNRYASYSTGKLFYQYYSADAPVCDDSGKFAIYTRSYIPDTRKAEEKQTLNTITIDLGSNPKYDLHLGNLISLDGEKYIITKIRGLSEQNSTSADNDKTIIEAVPFDGTKYYPPLAKTEPIRKSGPQTARVTDTFDPQRLNRVRVKYPWATSTDEISPWIRIAQPLAGEDTGFNFAPQEGDEALVDYEDGNVEKPYVVGMLYRCGQKPDNDSGHGTISNITSHDGQKIIFTDQNDADFVTSLSPALSTLAKFIPSISEKIPDDKTFGSIELTDRAGIYSMELSSTDRSIKINSTFGDIEINALTGITINAPNGDITIAGKNIDIKAGNRISIQSGANLTNNSEPWMPLIFNKLASISSNALAEKVVAPVDLKLLRCVVEMILRPISGTLSLKSNRYLTMEAGSGNVEILDEDWIAEHKLSGKIKQSFLNTFPFMGQNLYPKMVYNAAVTARHLLMDLHKQYYAFATEIQKKANEYYDLYNDLKNKTEFDTFQDIVSNANKKPTKKFEIDKKKKPDPNQNRNPDEVKKDMEKAGNELYQAAGGMKLAFEKLMKAIKGHQVGADIFEEHSKKINEELQKPDMCGRYYIINQLPVNSSTKKVEIQPQDFKPIEKENVREFVYMVMDWAIEYYNKKNSFYTVKRKKVDPKNHDFSQDTQWKEFVDSIKFVNAGEDNPQPASASQPAAPLTGWQSLWGTIKKYASVTGKGIGETLEEYSLQDVLDNNIWDSLQEGEILLSDKEQGTLHIQNKEITAYDANRSKDDLHKRLIHYLKTL